MFSLIERFPDAEFGSPGPLVQELAAIPGYIPLLLDTVRRQPTHHTACMVNRLLNTELPSDQRESWQSELRTAFVHSSCFRTDSPICTRFLKLLNWEGYS